MIHMHIGHSRRRAGLLALVLLAPTVAAAAGDAFTAVEHRRATVYHAPGTPGFTCWVAPG